MFDEAGFAQDTHVMGDGGFGEVAAEFSASTFSVVFGYELTHDFKTRFIRQCVHDGSERYFGEIGVGILHECAKG